MFDVNRFLFNPKIFTIMKKFTLFFIALFTATMTFAYDVEIDGVYYYLDVKNLTATVTSGDVAYSGFVSIPANIQHEKTIYTVSKINQSAFKQNKQLTSISIPNTIVDIAQSAFIGCIYLNSIYISDLTAWCNINFNGSDIFSSGTITNTGSANIYLNNEKLVDLIIPNDVISINANAFAWCTSIKTITIPDNVEIIGSHSFFNCDSVETLSIGKGIKEIQGYSFYGCSSLTSVQLADGIPYIGSWMFLGCKSLKTINIPNTVTFIGQSAFSSCSSLTSIILPNSITELRSGAFEKCSSLQSITFGSGNIKFYSSNFTNCTSLKSVYISDLQSWCQISHTSGDGDAPFIYGADLYLNNEKIIDLIIPEGVTRIGCRSFKGCSSIKSVTIPNSVTEIESEAFANCNNLNIVTLNPMVPPTLIHYYFPFTTSNISVCYIPKGTKNAYQEAWGTSMPFIDQEIELTINVPLPGGLEDAILDTGVRPNLVTKLILTGELNDDDFNFMRENMTSLYSVNLKNIKNKNLCTGFTNKKMLIEIILPDSITHVNGLEGTSIETIEIPKNAITIESNAFNKCNHLETILIPNTLCAIGNSAFQSCRSLKNITILEGANSAHNYKNSKIDSYAFSNCESLQHITIPDGINSCSGAKIFNNCSALKSITLPSNLTEINNTIFYNCINLDTITSLAITPPSISSIFNSINPNNCVLNVPTDAKRNYMEHDIWGQFLNIENVDVKKITITTSVNNPDYGNVSGGGEHSKGTQLTITAIPNEGYHFVKWSDGETNATRTIIVTTDITLTAEFAINVYTVTLSAQNGTVIGAGNYNHGTIINISATPAEGYHFVRWSDGNTDATRTFTATSNITLTAEFAINVYTISATAVNGTVIGAGEYQHGQTVTLTAVANANCHFIGWSDGVMDLTRTFVAAKDMTLTAYFASDKYLVMLSAENGTVTGAGEYEHGTTISISATPAEGYHFVKWSDGNTNATRSIVVTSNVTLTAEFAINIYTVNVTTVNGTIIGTGEYQHGATATLTAVATTGYHFVRWSDGVTDATRSIVIKSNVTLTAEFAINVYTVTLTAQNGTVTGSGNYNHGTTANITATPAEGYHFVKWSDGDTNVSRAIVVTENVSLSAEFAINVYNVTLSAVNGTVTGAGEYQHGATATITAVAAEGYHFVKWSDGVTETTRSFVMTSDVTLTAEFAINVYTISATAVNGTVTGAGEYQHGQTVTLTAVANPNCHFLGWSDGVMDLTRTFVATKDASFSAYFASDKYLVVLSAENGTVTGAGEYEHGTTINISATPAEGYHFVKWSDGDTNATRSIVVTSNVTLTAEFAINVYTVDVTVVNGSIIGDGEYQHGATATLTAVAAEGYHFVRWSDGVTDDTRSIVVTSNITLTAEFAINVYNVTLSAVNGTVTGAGEYQHGQTANISATPAEGYHFVKWSDGDTNASRAIVVTENVSLSAEFAINVYNVTLSAVNGTVTGAGEYEHGATATIIATPAEGYHFVKWSDGNTDATRSIVVTENVSLSAEFAINVYTIAVTAVNGTVTGAGEYQHGATIVLTAIANTGYRFVRWSDGVTESTRTFVAKENMNLTAEFTTDSYNVVLTTNDVMGRVIGSGTYAYGTTITIVAIPNAHYHFVKWSDGDTNDVRTIIVTEDVTLSAEFAANMYELTLIADENAGRVIGAGTYNYGTEVTIVAIANSGYKFSQWSDGDKNDVRTITISDNITLTAEFAAINVDVENIEKNSIIAYSQNQTLYIEGIEGNYYLLDITGKIIYYGDSHVVTLPCGVYIISTGEMYQKVIIRK